MEAAKPYKGIAMEGLVARWYSAITNKEFRHKQVASTLASKIPPGRRVLEIAPGPGYFSIELARLGDYRITGVDISQSFVEIARQNARQAGVKVDFRHGNASALPFPDESFDFMYCQAAFKNFTEPVNAIAEMYRVLAPAGTAVINDLRRDASPAEIERHVQSMELPLFSRWMTKLTFQNFLLKNAYSVAQMKSMVSQTPFQKYRVDTDEIGFTLWLEK